MGAKVRSQWAVLGPYDFVTVLEAPDNETGLARLHRARGAGLGPDDDDGGDPLETSSHGSAGAPGATGNGARSHDEVLKLTPDKCTGCLRCELACAYMQTGEFQPAKSVIGCRRSRGTPPTRPTRARSAPRGGA